MVDPHAELVTSTDGYGYSDPAHYDSAGYLDMGEKFAEAWTVCGAGERRRRVGPRSGRSQSACFTRSIRAPTAARRSSMCS
jgi:hypothetical protein